MTVFNDSFASVFNVQNTNDRIQMFNVDSENVLYLPLYYASFGFQCSHKTNGKQNGTKHNTQIFNNTTMTKQTNVSLNQIKTTVIQKCLEITILVIWC